MGYIIIDEKKLYEKITLWNSGSYKDKVLADVYASKADCSHMLEALKREEDIINEKIKRLEEQKSNLGKLIQLSNSLK